MNTYTGWQYLLIDLANAFGMDKETFESRIQWAERNLDQLEGLVDIAESKPLFYKAMLAIRKAQAKQPIGHLVEFDACCSGIQIMSALTGCVAGAQATGLVDPDRRADAYGSLRNVMAEVLGPSFTVSRADAKQALMTAFYGSKEEPKNIFGEGTPELNAFYQAAYQIAPGAWELLQDLLASWRPYALYHAWKLPDGFDARVKVMVKQEARIEVDELDHATFTYEFYENLGTKKGLSNAANVVHSVDAYVVRSMQRRCNYDMEMVRKAQTLIFSEIDWRQSGGDPNYAEDSKIAYYTQQYERSGMADVVILPYLNGLNIANLSYDHLVKLLAIVETMLAHKPFPVVTIHDAFKCHANNMNHLRQHYINILAELADSRVLADIMSQLYGRTCPVVKVDMGLADMIRGSNYSLS